MDRPIVRLQSPTSWFRATGAPSGTDLGRPARPLSATGAHAGAALVVPSVSTVVVAAGWWGLRAPGPGHLNAQALRFFTAARSARSTIRTGRSGRGSALPEDRGAVSTSVARARSAPTVHSSRGITENGS